MCQKRTRDDAVEPAPAGNASTELGAEYTAFLETYKDQLSASDIPERLWPSVFTKVSTGTFDAGLAFEFRKDSTNGWHLICTQEIAQYSCVWLVDHSISLPAGENDREEFIKSQPVVQQRLGEILGLVSEDESAVADTPAEGPAIDVDVVLRELRGIVGEYMVTSSSDEDAGSSQVLQVAYVEDEVGSRVKHCADTPNLGHAVFIHETGALSLLWPKLDMHPGDIATRCRTYLLPLPAAADAKGQKDDDAAMYTEDVD